MSYVISVYRNKLDRLPKRELYRYMGAKDCDDGIDAMIEEALPRFLEKLDCKACFMEVPVSIHHNMVDLDVIRLESADLARNLRGCTGAILFAATIGAEADRQRYAAAVTSPAKALVFDAMGSAAIEEFCDELCESFLQKHKKCRLHPRFSPGYGDLSLNVQRELLCILDAHRQIGLSLSDSLMMLPQKSVTAIVGIEMPADL